MMKFPSRVMMIALMAIPVAGFSAEDRNTKGYATDSDGNILMDSYGNCVRAGNWTPEMAVVDGCDGFVGAHEAMLIQGEPIEDGVVSFEVPFGSVFAVDSTVITEEGKDYLAKLTDKARSALSKAYSITIVGHTDSTGPKKHNEELSLARADAVAEYLAELGVPTDKLRTLGVGSDEPIAENSTDEGRAMNRRAEIYVVGQPRALDRMVMPSVALFPRRSADLTEEGKAMLLESAKEARDTFKKAVVIEVIGHTDDVGTAEYNQELSEARAQAVGNYLVDQGILPSNKIVMTGAGKDEPIANNATAEGRQENRRVEILVVGRAKQIQ